MDLGVMFITDEIDDEVPVMDLSAQASGYIHGDVGNRR